MKFGAVPIALAAGHLLAHNVVVNGKRVLSKGRSLVPADLDTLRCHGLLEVVVAQLEPTDIAEDAAAERLGEALAGPESGLVSRTNRGGRVTLLSASRGVLSVEPGRILAINSLAGVTVATLPQHRLVMPRETVATVKIIPFALPEPVLLQALREACHHPVRVRPMHPRRVRLLVLGTRHNEARLRSTYEQAMTRRLNAQGQNLESSLYIEASESPVEALAPHIERAAQAGVELLLLASETATMDDADVLPSALRHAGGTVVAVGAPVFPGNLLLAGEHGTMSVLGLPGCARGSGSNVVDLLLPRLLCGERLTAAAVAHLGVGGLLVDSVRDTE